MGALSVLVGGVIISKINLSQKKAEASSVLSFPKDHGQHPSFVTEWWYLNLLTRTTENDGSNERDLGYVISFSQIAGTKNLLSSRYEKGSNTFRENTITGGNLSVSLTENKYLLIKYSSGETSLTLKELPPGNDRRHIYKLVGKTPEIGNVDLTLKERSVVSSGYNTPLLWGGTTGNCQGRISVFSQNDTYYYSIPDLDITGTIIDINGVKRVVKIGKAWIDHQWFNSSPSVNWKGHYWANLHYTFSNDLYNSGHHNAIGFVTQIYLNGPKYTYWVKRNEDGTNECGVDANITINKYGSTNYPASWKIALGDGSIYLPITIKGVSFSDNQIFKPPLGERFIEAASYYSGTIDSKSFTGLGFFETAITNLTK